MALPSVAIVGSGIAAIFVSKVLGDKGYRVTLFEKGPEFPYPHTTQFQQRLLHLPDRPSYGPAADLRSVTLSGAYQHAPDGERGMVVGGSATHWTAITPRMHPPDFQTRSRFGFGSDWPLSYDDLEPYYGQAEALIGISGTDDDNPFAPPRSTKFPLPAFELTHADRLLADRLRDAGITLHTTPQARTRHAYDGRPACQNFNACELCPIGARYSPNHELQRLLAAGRVSLRTETSVRRIVMDRGGKARGLLIQPNESERAEEFPADIVIIAAGGIESSRLLLLSHDERNPDGMGNQRGRVGQQFTFHHMWVGRLRYKEKLYAGGLGAVTGQTQQFCNPPDRGRHGGIKVEFSSHYSGLTGRSDIGSFVSSGPEILKYRGEIPHCRGIIFHAESAPGPTKSITLSTDSDRFGDRFAHVHYEGSDFDRRTYDFAQQLLRRFAESTRGTVVAMQAAEEFHSGAHHMGGCCMGVDPNTSVVDSFGRVHGAPNLFVVGSAVFPGTSGSMNPTLTLSALALRTAEHIARQSW